MEYTAGGKGNAVAPQTVVDEDHHERAERTTSTRAREDLAASPSASPGLGQHGAGADSDSEPDPSPSRFDLGLLRLLDERLADI